VAISNAASRMETRRLRSDPGCLWRVSCLEFDAPKSSQYNGKDVGLVEGSASAISSCGSFASDLMMVVWR
jgi:hypothetical protein